MYKTIKPGIQEQGMKCRDAGDGGILYSGKYCQAFRGMSQNIPGECPQTFGGMSANIQGNVPRFP